MKIVKFIIALSFICCAVTNPVSADPSEFQQLSAEIVNLKNSGLSPILYQMALNCVERNIKKMIQKKERQISRCQEEIEYYQNQIQRFDSGDRDEYYNENDRKRWASEIENYKHEKIVECQEDIGLFRDLLSQVQALKQ